MTLDERLRGELRRVVDAGGIDADTLFDDVRAAHRRGALPAHVARQHGPW